MNVPAVARGCVLAHLSILAVFAGCSEGDPPPAYNYDLGDGTIALPPTGSARVNAMLADGRADWPAFRKPQDHPSAAGPDDTSAGEGAQQELQALVKEYNDLVDDAKTEDLLDYFVEEQHDSLRPWLETALSLTAKLKTIRAELEKKLPDSSSEIAEAFDLLLSATRPGLTIGDITVTNDTEASTRLSLGDTSTTLRFVIVDEEWYFKLDRPEQFAALKPLLATAGTAYDGWLTALQSGRMTPEQALQTAQTAASAIRSALERTGTTPSPAQPGPAGKP